MSENSKIELTFVDFKVEYHGSCAYDFVEGTYYDIAIFIFLATTSSFTASLCSLKVLSQALFKDHTILHTLYIGHTEPKIVCLMFIQFIHQFLILMGLS